MTKQDLIKSVAAQTGASAYDVKIIIEATFSSIKQSVEDELPVYLRGFGTFGIKHRAEKNARNITKGTTIIVPAHNVPYFKPSKKFTVK